MVRVAPTFVEGADRNDPDGVRSHLYVDTGADEQQLVPMCEYGWNRSDGFAFSILRGHTSRRGLCTICNRNRRQGKPPVSEPRGHKTRWI